jgi:hypothetical protein
MHLPLPLTGATTKSAPSSATRARSAADWSTPMDYYRGALLTDTGPG